MSNGSLGLSCALMALIAACPTAAQESGASPPARQGDMPVTAADDDMVADIVVIAQRLRTQVDAAQAPIVELDEADIAAYGVNSIAELVTSLEPETGSARGRGGGRPIFLVNGIRIGSFRELRSYPPEALKKVEVLPEEVAQKFGFSPDRRVMNFILKDDFSSREIELEYEQPDRGGYLAEEGEFTLLKIAGGGRLNLNFEASDTSLLTEAERDIEQTPGSLPDIVTDPDPAEFRSLVSDSSQVEGTVNWARAFLGSGSSLSLNLTGERQDTRSLSGIDTVLLVAPEGSGARRTFNADDPLERRGRNDMLAVSGAYTRQVGPFRLTATADASLVDSRTLIERRADVTALLADAASGVLAIDGTIPVQPDAGFDRADTDLLSAGTKATLRGTVLKLPTGEVALTLDAGYDWDRIESSDTRSPADTKLTRGDLSAGVNFAIPLTSRRNGSLAAVGDVSLNLQAGFNDLSDFGTLYDWSAGITWSPIDDLELQATYVWRETAPGLIFLGNPQTQTFNVPTFDFTTGQTVLATITTGGNPNLVAETQNDWKFSVNWKLPTRANLRLRVDYARNRSRNVSSSFPVLTPAVEAAFPGRVARDANGQLLAIDRRPITFVATRANRLSVGLVSRGRFGKARPQASGPGGRDDVRGAGPRGPMNEERRARFAAFRERLCGEDGSQQLIRLADALESGKPLEEEFPGLSPERAERMASRFRGEDGTIDRERLEMFRNRICSRGGSPGRRGSAGQGGKPGRGTASVRGRGGLPGFGRRGDGRGRYFLSLTHSIELDNEIRIAPGIPALDQLDGDALSSSGLPRHSTRLEGGLFWNGFGTRISARYVGKTFITGSGAPGSTDLFFDDLATVNLRLFANLGRIMEKDAGFWQGARISLRADNIFDARRRVVDSNGDTPLGFQPLLIDPTGRYLGIQLRKLF